MADLPEVHGSVLWLKPDQKSAAYFRNWISRLAKKYNSPVFEPHITLSDDISSLPPEKVKSALKETARLHKAFSLECTTAECRENPYQKFIIKTDPSDSLAEVYKTIDKVLGGSYSKKKDPHLSLLYNSLPCKNLTVSIQSVSRNLPYKLYIQSISLISLNGTPDVWENKFAVTLED